MKYKVGDFVFSWANPTKKCEIKRIKPSYWLGKNIPHVNDTFHYKLILSNGKESKWISEDSLSNEEL